MTNERKCGDCVDLQMEKIVLINTFLDIFGIALTLLPIVYLLSGIRYQQRINQHFLGVAIFNIFMIIGGLPDWIFPAITEPWMKTTLLILTAVFYIACAFVLYFFARYIIEYLKLSGKTKRICLASVMTVCTVQIVFAGIKPVYRLHFLCDQ